MERKEFEKILGENFATRLKLLMDEKQCSPRKLSEISGIPEKRIQIWLNKRICPSTEYAIKVSDALECSLEYLFR